MIVADLCIYFFPFFCNSSSLLVSFALLHECIIFLQPMSLKTAAVTLLCCPTTGANLYFTPRQTQLLLLFPLFTVRSCPQKSWTILCHLFIRVPGQILGHLTIFFTICTCVSGVEKDFYFGIFCIIKESKRFNHKNNFNNYLFIFSGLIFQFWKKH